MWAFKDLVMNWDSGRHLLIIYELLGNNTTAAVSLECLGLMTHKPCFPISREKQKSEAKDRKVLEILQVKDVKIQELEQVVF